MSLELKKHIEQIVPLTDEEFDDIVSHFKPKQLKKHQYLIQQMKRLKKFTL